MGDPTESERAMLQEWTRERDDLNSLIAALEKRIGLRGGAPGAVANGVGKIKPDEFFRLSTPEAIKKFLKLVGKPARPIQEIIDGLNAGGMDTNYTNVYTALLRLQKRGVAKVNDNWGLDEWYPPATAREAKPERESLIPLNGNEEKESDTISAEEGERKP